MSRNVLHRSHLLTVAAGGLALAMVAAPVQFAAGDLVPSKSIALADKGGNPNGGNGNGGGKGNGGGGGGGTSPSASAGDDNSGGGFAFGEGGHNSHNTNSSDNRGRGWAFGKGGHTSHNPNSAHDNPGGGGPNISSLIKWFNAAHANADAFRDAAPNSRVGLIAAYFGIATTPQDLADLTAVRDAAQVALDAEPANQDLIDALADAQADLDTALAAIDAVDLALAQAVVDAQVALSDDPDNAGLQTALADAQDALTAALADNEADALLAVNKGSDLVDTTDSDVIDRVREILGLT